MLTEAMIRGIRRRYETLMWTAASQAVEEDLGALLEEVERLRGMGPTVPVLLGSIEAAAASMLAILLKVWVVQNNDWNYGDGAVITLVSAHRTEAQAKAAIVAIKAKRKEWNARSAYRRERPDDFPVEGLLDAVEVQIKEEP